MKRDELFYVPFKTLCAVKYDGGYERAKGREEVEGKRRASERFLELVAFDLLDGLELNVQLTVLCWDHEGGCVV